MTDAAPPYTREYVVDEGYPARIAAVAAGQVLRTPWPWIGVGTALLAGALGLRADAEFLWPIAALALLTAVSLPLVTYILNRRIWKRQFPPGSILRTGFGEQFVSMQSPMESSTTAYAVYSGAKRRGDFVLLRMRANRAWGILPGELVSDEDLARFPQS